jgi:hypothetical protein
MLSVTIALAAGLATIAYAQPPPLPHILSRVAEEAEVLQQNIARTVTLETLEQRTLLAPSRFRPGAADSRLALEGQTRVQVREVVSQYTVGPIGQSESGNLLEFREVISVNGHRLQSPEAARHALSLDMRSPDDRLRKRILEDLAKNGLVDIATDYAMMLLAFTKRGLEQLKFGASRGGRIGADDALVVDWQQTSAAAGQLEFRGKRVARLALQGVLWVRKSDGLPLRIQAWTEHTESRISLRDEASIEYTVSGHGFLAPASVVHRHIVDGRLVTENLYRYEPFRLFAADSEIKFTDVPELTTRPQAKRK